MPFPLNDEPSPAGVIYPHLERGDVQRGGAGGELDTAPGAVAARCTGHCQAGRAEGLPCRDVTPWPCCSLRSPVAGPARPL